MADGDQTEQLGLDLDDPRVPPRSEGPSEAFQTAVGAVVVLFVLVALVGGAMRLLGGGDQVQLEGGAQATEDASAAPDAGSTEQPGGASPAATAGAEVAEGAEGGEGAPDADATPSADSTLSPEAAALVAAAPEPADTPVQLLDGVRDEARVAAARQVLEELGYPIAATSRTRTPYSATTVLYVDGAEPAGLALRARDARFGVVESAPDSLTADVQLHVIVGQDWPAQAPGGA